MRGFARPSRGGKRIARVVQTSTGRGARAKVRRRRWHRVAVPPGGTRGSARRALSIPRLMGPSIGGHCRQLSARFEDSAPRGILLWSPSPIRASTAPKVLVPSTTWRNRAR